MIYLSGTQFPLLAEAADAGLPVGIIMQPRVRYRRWLHRYPYWAADNDCFAQGAAFRLPPYLRWLEAHAGYPNCLFATAPDVVGDAEATLLRSLPVLPRIRARGYKAALVAQDGLVPGMVPWDDLDVLFLGGTGEGGQAWKTSPAARRLTQAARAEGKWVHMGRVNSLRRLQAAVLMGVHSVDGTFLAWGPDVNLERLRGWFATMEREPFLPGIAVGG